ncbi:MAG: hypothetical protein U1E65_29050 [Myxococcota bacterium]
MRSAIVLGVVLAAACSEPASNTGPADASAGDLGSASADTGLELRDADAPAADATAAIDADAAAAPDADAPPDAGGRRFQVIDRYDDRGHGLLFQSGKLYSVNSAADVVYVYDGLSFTKTATIPVGALPLRLVSDGRYLYCLNAMARDAGDAFLSIIDPATDRVVASLSVEEKQEGSDPDNYPWTNFPAGLAVLDGALYITFPTNAEPDILRVDIGGAWRQHPLFPAGSGPDDLAAAQGRLFVINMRALLNPADDVLLVLGTDGSPVRTLDTGGGLKSIRAVDGRVLLTRAFPNSAGGELMEIDPITTATRSVEACPGAFGIAEAGGPIWVSCPSAKLLRSYDRATLAPLERIDLSAYQPSIEFPRGIAVSPRGDLFLESDQMISVLTAP